MKTIVRCRCGRRISSRDVLRSDRYPRALAPSLIWIKYRCRRCKLMGESFIAEESFDRALLHEDRRELSDPERDKFADTEAITADELLDFRAELARLETLTMGTFEALA